MYFTTTRFHQEHAGARFIDIIIAEAHDPISIHPFKGNVDLAKLERVLEEHPGKVPYGGMAGRDMEAMARGIVESVEVDHIRARIGQVGYVGELLEMDYEPECLRFFQARFRPLA